MIGAIVAKRAMHKGFAALNSHDLAQFMAAWDDDASFEYPGAIGPSGGHSGKPAVEDWFRQFFEQFPTIEFSIRDICVRNAFDLLGNNVIAVHWELHAINREGFEGRNSGVTMVTIRRGKALVVKDFLFNTSDDWRRAWGAPQVGAAAESVRP